MNDTIKIIKGGRGLQLSTSRVTVQDLLPYFQEGCSYEEIIRWIPSLAAEEIAVVEQYYLDHKGEMDAQDRRIREHNCQRKNPDWVEKIVAESRAERLAMLEKLGKAKPNGEG